MSAGLPDAIAGLPRCTDTGLPVPFSSGTDADGAGQFGKNDVIAKMLCAIGALCGVCGGKIDREPAFLALGGGPVDLGGLVFADPPNHEECAEAAMTLCPFIARSRGRRSDGAAKPGWLMIIAASSGPCPAPPGHGLVGFAPGPVLRVRRFTYDDRGHLAEVTTGGR